MPHVLVYSILCGTHKSHVPNHFRFPFYGRDQHPPCSGSRGEGSAAGVLLLQLPAAGADSKYEDVNACRIIDRGRQHSHLVLMWLILMFCFCYICLVAIVDVGDAISAAVVAVVGATVAFDVLAQLMMLLLFLLLSLL